MLRLTTFGGLSLGDERGPLPGAALPRRALALLALLAAAGERGLSRDKLLGHLWPDSEMEKARAVLRQWLSRLRRDLREDELFMGTADLRLNPHRITSDVAEFEQALARCERERAASLYNGPFLDGFFLNDAPEFERWVEAERARLDRRVRSALEALAAEAEDRGEYVAASQWWRRLAELDPLSSRVAVHLMSTLAAAGDRAAALQHARVHETLLREELGSAPDRAVTELAATLRIETSGAVAANATTVTTGHAAATSPASPTTRAAVASEPLPRRYVLPALSHRYHLEEKLGRTALATAYVARDLERDRRIVLKVLEPVFAALLDVERFLSEMDVARQLSHPGLLPILEVDAAEGVVFYVAPYLEGDTLRDLLKRERQLALEDALRIACEVAGALDYAHVQGVTHLDLKPRTILLTGQSAVMADLGIARAIVAAAGDRATQTGATVGTSAYMSPEQVAGELELDGRSDIYSLGCVLFHMLAGEPPFVGPTAQAALSRRVTEPPPKLRSARPGVPKHIERAVMKALARVHADRFRTAGEFRDALAGA